MKIVSMCGDAGGANTLFPVIQELQARGHEVVVGVANGGVAANILLDRGIDVEGISTPRNLLSQHSNPDIYISSMCSGVAVHALLERLLDEYAGICLRVGIQDIWWSGLRYECLPPDKICTGDEVGKRLISEVLKLPEEHIKITGFPAMTELGVEYDSQEGDRIREKLGISGKLVVFAGQTVNTAFVLSDVLHALLSQNFPVHVVAKRHPRMMEAVAGQSLFWTHLLEQGKMLDGDHFSMQDLIAAADVVCAAFSTALLEARAVGKPAISVLLPETGLSAFQNETGLSSFPLADLGVMPQACNERDLHHALRDALSGEFPYKPFEVDRQAPQKVADFLETLV